jgi:MinD-like ATPase involved in chromosome partitioning or flagellar assembly
VGLTALRDAESGETAIYDMSSKSVRRALANASAHRIETLERGLRRRGIDFIHIDASASVVDPLIAFFRMREKRIRR